MLSRNDRRLNRQRKTKAVIRGTKEQPRVSLFRSQKSISVQVIDDINRVTLLSVNNIKSAGKDFSVDSCEKLGEDLAKKIIEKKINRVVFDRNGYRYHGKVKAVAEGLRKGGINF